MPIADQAAQQVGTPQKRRITRRRAAQHEVVAAAGTGVAAIDHEFLGGQTVQARLFVKKLGALHQLRPARRRLHVDLDHAWVRCNTEIGQAWVGRWFIAFQQNRATQLLGR